MNLVKYLSSKPSSLKSRFRRRFIRSLMRIKTETPLPTSSSPREIFLRSRKIKIAADKSMALAVGSKKAWSRAMLWKIQYKARRHRALGRRICYHPNIRKKRFKEVKKKRKERDEEVIAGGFREAGELRKLVPGGERMDLCSLLDETAHYLKCLVTQVQVMRSIDEIYSI